MPSKDAAMVRMGINLGSPEEEAKAARLAVTMNETMVRFLNLLRLVIVGLPVVLQSCWIHSVDLTSWFLRLFVLYAVVGIIGMLVAPEQAFYAMGLKEFRWAFERLYPEAKHWNGNPNAADTDPDPNAKLMLEGPSAINNLGRKELRVRWHGSDNFMGLDKDGWVVQDSSAAALQILMRPLMDNKGERVPDTYTLQVRSRDGKWDGCWLSCTPVNHLRFGGWLRAYQAEKDACPFKLIQDSACHLGTCKMLSAYATPPQQTPLLGKDPGHIPAGFYLVQQRHAGRVYVGQAPDAEADFFEFLEVPTVVALK